MKMTVHRHISIYIATSRVVYTNTRHIYSPQVGERGGGMQALGRAARWLMGSTVVSVAEKERR
jgi:hypothetical protein